MLFYGRSHFMGGRVKVGKVESACVLRLPNLPLGSPA